MPFHTYSHQALRHYCKCHGFHNPETALFRCESCDKWLHETCLLEAALDAKWEELTNSAPDAIPVTKQEDDDENTIRVSDQAKHTDGRGSTATPSQPGVSSSAKPEPKKKKQGKGKKSLVTASKPWEGLLEARLGYGEQQPPEPNGKVVITDSRDEDVVESPMKLKCLFCDATIT